MLIIHISLHVYLSEECLFCYIFILYDTEDKRRIGICIIQCPAHSIQRFQNTCSIKRVFPILTNILKKWFLCKLFSGKYQFVMGFVWSPKNIYFHLNAVSCVFPDWLPDCKMFFPFQIPPDHRDHDDNVTCKHDEYGGVV